MSVCFCVLCEKQFPTYNPSIGEAFGCATSIEYITDFSYTRGFICEYDHALCCGYGSKYDENVYSIPKILTASPHIHNLLVCDNCIDTLVNNKEIVLLYSTLNQMNTLSQ